MFSNITKKLRKLAETAKETNNTAPLYTGTNENTNSGTTETTTPVQMTEEEKRMEAAKSGDTWWNGPMNTTQLGKSLQNNINQQMAGQESNSLLNAKTAGAEALARKAQDIRGAAAQNSILNGQLGQGMAQTGKMQAELATMQQLGDFQTNMAQLAGQEQQQAQQNAIAALQLMQGDEQLAETKRQSLIADALADDRFNLDLIAEARKGQLSGTYNAAMDEFSSEILSPEAMERARQGNATAAESEAIMNTIRAQANTLDSDAFNELITQDPNTGQYSYNGVPLTPQQYLEVSQMSPLSDSSTLDSKLANQDFDSMTNTEFFQLTKDPVLRDSAGVIEGDFSIGGLDSFYGIKNKDGYEKYKAEYVGKIYYDESTQTYYRINDTEMRYKGNSFRVRMFGEALNGPNKGQTTQVGTSRRHRYTDKF